MNGHSVLARRRDWQILYNFTSSSRHILSTTFLFAGFLQHSVVRNRQSIYFRRRMANQSPYSSSEWIELVRNRPVHPPDFSVVLTEWNICTFPSANIPDHHPGQASRSNVFFTAGWCDRIKHHILHFVQHSKQEFYYLEKYHASTMDLSTWQARFTTRDWYNINKRFIIIGMMTDD